MNSPAIMARRSYLRACCNLVIVHSHCVGRRIDEYIGGYRLRECGIFFPQVFQSLGKIIAIKAIRTTR